MEYEKHFNISSRKKWAIGLDMAKMEMLGSAAGLEDASRVPYRPASLGKDGMTRRGYGVNTDLIYMYSQYICIVRLCPPSIFFAGREGMIPGGEVRRPFAPFGAEAPIFIDIPVYLCYYLV